MSKKTTRMLTAEEETALLNAYLDHNDITARNALIEAYLPLATRAADAFSRRGKAPLADLVQEATLAVAQAIDNFKRGQGSRLSTLAPYYIKAALMRFAMDYHGAVRIGTNLPDKRVFMGMRKMVSEIQAKNGGMPITDADRQAIADRLRVKLDAVKRMEPRIFANDLVISHTDISPDEDDDRTVTSSGTIAVEGGQAAVEVELDQREVMGRIMAIVEANYDDRDLEIVRARLAGEMTPEGYKALTSAYGITVERVRQIQRGALLTIREALKREGITGLDAIAC